VLQAAKTQRWAPEELLRTLVEAEISARDEVSAYAETCRFLYDETCRSESG